MNKKKELRSEFLIIYSLLHRNTADMLKGSKVH